MQTRHLILLSLLVATFSGSVIAAEATPAQDQSAHKHKKDCVDKSGKPCHLHKHEADAQKPAALKQDQAASAIPASTVAATSAVTATSKPKAEPPLSDAAGRALAQNSGCFTCHAIDRRVVGPAWKAVAERYRNNPDAEAALVTKVSRGGQGVWGSTPMPANSPRVHDADIRALVKFVLSLK